MKILLVGASGLLGRKLLQTIPSTITCISTFNNIPVPVIDAVQLDITNKSQVDTVVNEVRPDLILHCASLVYVDYCESHKQLTWDINVKGTKNLLEAAQKIRAKFFFFSSNGIFDGTKPPYVEEDRANPVNVYGKTKYAAEKLVTGMYNDSSIIFRLNTTYGLIFPNARENPVTWIVKRLQQKQETNMVQDVYNNHLWVGQAADCVWKAIEKKRYGEIFHIGGADCLSRYALAKAIAKTFNLDINLIKPVKSNFFPSLAPRPKNTCFDMTKMVAQLDVQPVSVEDGLRAMKEELKQFSL